nr:hypothetical protein [Tanacetum cinerariifolium]
SPAWHFIDVVEMDMGLYPLYFEAFCRLKAVGKTCDELGGLGGKGKGVQGMYSPSGELDGMSLFRMVEIRSKPWKQT